MSQADCADSTAKPEKSSGCFPEMSRRSLSAMLIAPLALAVGVSMPVAAKPALREIDEVRDAVRKALADLGPVERYIGAVDEEAGLTSQQMSVREAYRHRQLDIVLQELFS
jgi:hypothetical protein